MDDVFVFLLVVLTLYYGFTCIQFISFLSIKKKSTLPLTSYPNVSVLIAARNEEEHIFRCLQALEKQSYPLDRIQVLIGDDDSDDGTDQVIHRFKTQYPHLNTSVIPIQSSLQGLQGKANVLAHLFHRAEGEFVFITDADIAVSPSWIQGLVSTMQTHDISAASGSTFVESETLFGTFQALEWIEAFGLLHAADHYRIDVTAVGNNMVVSKKAYDAVGGYENIPFSVTEDLELYLALKKNKAQHKQVLNSEVIAWTTPIDSALALLKQRKRWLKGVERTPWICQAYMGVHALLGMFILLVMAYEPCWGMALYVFSVGVHLLRITWITQRTNVPFKLIWLLYVCFLDLYQLIFSLSILVYYVLPVGVEWKKRVY